MPRQQVAARLVGYACRMWWRVAMLVCGAWLLGCGAEVTALPCPTGEADPAVDDKRHLVGDDLGDPADNPVFLSQLTVIEGSPSFPPGYVEPSVEVRFEVGRDRLVARRLDALDGDAVGVFEIVNERNRCGTRPIVVTCITHDDECMRQSGQAILAPFIRVAWSRNLAAHNHRLGPDAAEVAFEPLPHPVAAPQVALERGEIALPLWLAAVWDDRSEELLIRHTLTRAP